MSKIESMSNSRDYQGIYIYISVKQVKKINLMYKLIKHPNKVNILD